MTLIRKTLLIYVIGFVLFAVGRFFLGDPGFRENIPLPSPINMSSQDFAYGKRNIASAPRERLEGSAGGDAKYEQIATIASHTGEFEAEETRLRGLIESFGGVIQFEQGQGLAGRRSLKLSIGIAPARFDDMVTATSEIGTLSWIDIDKTDKTNEYRDLQASKVSLEKSRDALIALKQRDGDIKSLIELESEILALEQQIQSLGVNLGDFDTENEFSTVRLTLTEKITIASTLGIPGKIFAAVIWTAQYYTLVWFGLLVCLTAIFLGGQILISFGKFFRNLEEREQ